MCTQFILIIYIALIPRIVWNIWACPGRVLKFSLFWPFWDISKNVLSQSVLCPFFFFSNLSHVLSQTCLKMCPRPDMSRTRPGRVPDVSSKCRCPDRFGTSPNRTSATKAICTYVFLYWVNMMGSFHWYWSVFIGKIYFKVIQRCHRFLTYFRLYKWTLV